MKLNEKMKDFFRVLKYSFAMLNIVFFIMLFEDEIYTIKGVIIIYLLLPIIGSLLFSFIWVYILKPTIEYIKLRFFTEEDDGFYCQYCEKLLKTLPMLEKHEKSCKLKKS
jgi:hypothetical protein